MKDICNNVGGRTTTHQIILTVKACRG